MRSLHVMGGGRAGALLVTERGARALRPLPEGVLSGLRAVNQLCLAAAAAPDKATREKINRALVTLTNIAVDQVEKVVGELSGDASLVYQDDDGGFTCGSTGKPPIPFPWPPSPLPNAGDLIAEGVVDAGVIELVQAARAKGIAPIRLYSEPAKVAKELGLALSEKAKADLELASPARLKEVKDPVDREILEFFHKVAADGRHMDAWYRRPVEVAERLKVKLTSPAIEKIIAGEISGAFSNPGWRADVGTSIVVIAVADTIIITVYAVRTTQDLPGTIVDRSGIAKI